MPHGVTLGDLNRLKNITLQSLQIQSNSLTATSPTNPLPLIYLSATDAVTAAGTTQATATAVQEQIIRVTTCAAGAGIVLPSTTQVPGSTSPEAGSIVPNGGAWIIVRNSTANALQVYGSGSDTIEDSAATVGVSIPPNSTSLFISSVTGKWYSDGNAPDQSTFVSTTVLASYITNTTVATVSGLSTALLGGATYQIHGQLQGAASATTGIKVTLTGTNGLTLTLANMTGWNYNGTTLNTVTNITNLNSDFSNSSAAYTNLVFDGTFITNAAGTLNIAASQNTSNSPATTIKPGSYLSVTRIS